MKTNTIIVLSSFITLFAPIGPLVTIALISIGFDFGFGIWRSVKSRRKEGSSAKIGDIIQSTKMLATGVKGGIYAATIGFFYLVEKFIAGDIIAHFISIELLLTKAIALFFVFIEVKSMNESYKDVTGKDMLKAFRDFITGLKTESDKWKN
jgi:hypothetical protein